MGRATPPSQAAIRAGLSTSPYQSGTGDYGSADTRRTLEGVTKETFSRLLRELANQGLIAVEKRDIVLRDRARLAEIARPAAPKSPLSDKRASVS